MLNDKVLPFFTSQEMGLIRISTDKGTEYCGKEIHDFQLYLSIDNIEHMKTKARHPQTNGVCEHFHKAILHEFYQLAFRKKLYNYLEKLQANLDVWLNHYNTEWTHQGKVCAVGLLCKHL